MQKMKQRGLALAVMASLMTTLPGTAWAAEQDAQSSEVAQMREEIAALTARLNTLEKQLKAQEDKDKKAAKAEKSKAPTLKWSGSTKNGYMKNEEHKQTVKSEMRLKAKTQVDNTYDIAFGLKFKSTSSEPDKDDPGAEKNKVKLDAASIGRAFGPVYVNAGVQSATVGEGLWLGKSSLNIFSARYAMTPRDSLFTGYGRDSQDYLSEDKKTRSRILKYVDYQHHFTEDSLLGVYWGGQQPEHYIGIYAETPIVGKLSFMGEFVHDNNHDKPNHSKRVGPGDFKLPNNYGYVYTGSKSNTDGYLLSLSYGSAKNKGDLLTTLNYFNVDQNLFMDDGYTAYDDYVGNRGIMGFGLVLDYMTSKHTKLSLERYWAHTKPVAGNVNLDGDEVGKAPYYTTYLKFTSKF